jgi:hypothetical protein
MHSGKKHQKQKARLFQTINPGVAHSHISTSPLIPCHFRQTLIHTIPHSPIHSSPPIARWRSCWWPHAGRCSRRRPHAGRRSRRRPQALTATATGARGDGHRRSRWRPRAGSCDRWRAQGGEAAGGSLLRSAVQASSLGSSPYLPHRMSL